MRQNYQKGKIANPFFLCCANSNAWKETYHNSAIFKERQKLLYQTSSTNSEVKSQIPEIEQIQSPSKKQLTKTSIKQRRQSLKFSQEIGLMSVELQKSSKSNINLKQQVSYQKVRLPHTPTARTELNKNTPRLSGLTKFFASQQKISFNSPVKASHRIQTMPSECTSIKIQNQKQKTNIVFQSNNLINLQNSSKISYLNCKPITQSRQIMKHQYLTPNNNKFLNVPYTPTMNSNLLKPIDQKLIQRDNFYNKSYENGNKDQSNRIQRDTRKKLFKSEKVDSKKYECLDQSIIIRDVMEFQKEEESKHELKGSYMRNDQQYIPIKMAESEIKKIIVNQEFASPKFYRTNLATKLSVITVNSDDEDNMRIPYVEQSTIVVDYFNPAKKLFTKWNKFQDTKQTKGYDI